MKKGKNLVAIGLCLALCYIPMQAAGYYVTKNVQYGGVNLYYNGSYQNATAKAVVIDETTYLPVRAFGNMLGINIDWNKNTQTVNVNGIANTALSAQAELQAKDYEIAALRKELAELKQEGVISSTNSSSSSYETTSGNDISSSEVSDTRRALDNTYSDYFSDIDLDFSLSHSSNRLRVNISIDDSSDYREFNKLSRSEVRNFIEDVCEFIRDRHDDIVIVGNIEYDNTNRYLYSFTYSKSDSLSYSGDSYYNDDEWSDDYSLQRIIDRTSYVKIDGYSSSIDVKEARLDISDSREYIQVRLYLNITDDMKSAWNRHTGEDNDTVLRSYLRDMAEDLYDETDYDIEIVLYNNSTRNSIGYYQYDDNEIYLYSI
ncbi:MAG: hypothetical protein E7231_15340 [Cellulosilyticum sp.]|nr:hypothetical protein [Cellulosilyticum sp.]